MQLSKYILYFIFLSQSYCNCFIATSNNLALNRPQLIKNKQISLHMNEKNSSLALSNYKNESKVYKINFPNIYEDDDGLFEPRYSFGLSEYDIIILRIYVNIIVTIYTLILVVTKS